MSIQEDYLILMERTIKQFRKFSQQELKKRGFDVSSDQYQLMQNVSIMPGISQKEIADKTGKDPASVTRMLDLLEKRKLIIRKADKNDRRSYSILLSELGVELMEDLSPLMTEMKSFGFRGIDEKDSDVFIKVMNKVLHNIT